MQFEDTLTKRRVAARDLMPGSPEISTT